jgi:hypothetical protein
MYMLGLDRLASTGASLTGSDSLGPSHVLYEAHV